MHKVVKLVGYEDKCMCDECVRERVCRYVYLRRDGCNLWLCSSCRRKLFGQWLYIKEPPRKALALIEEIE